MTPNVAEELWCPFARRAMGENRGVHGMPVDGTKCLADSCMAWAWDDLSRLEGHCELINFPPLQVLTSPD